MSAYAGRRAPAMSEYLANLNNNAPLAQDSLEEGEGLNVFANADFFDFDMATAANVDFDQHDVHRRPHETIAAWNPPTSADFLNGDFQFTDLHGLPPLLTNDNATNLTPISPSTNYPVPPQNLAALAQSPITPTASSAKRKLAEYSDPAITLEERTRFAAEEDKRRRNTAASARFRVKKKQREQALEKTAKEMTGKANVLEKKVQELEMENRWLKSLITEKDGEGDIRERYARYIAEGGETAERGDNQDDDA